MSIGYRKISDMITKEVRSIDNFDETKMLIIIDLCNKIYLEEASTDSMSGARTVDSIVGEITRFADRLKEEGGAQ